MLNKRPKSNIDYYVSKSFYLDCIRSLNANQLLHPVECVSDGRFDELSLGSTALVAYIGLILTLFLYYIKYICRFASKQQRQHQQQQQALRVQRHIGIILP